MQAHRITGHWPSSSAPVVKGRFVSQPTAVAGVVSELYACGAVRVDVDGVSVRRFGHPRLNCARCAGSPGIRKLEHAPYACACTCGLRGDGVERPQMPVPLVLGLAGIAGSLALLALVLMLLWGQP